MALAKSVSGLMALAASLPLWACSPIDTNPYRGSNQQRVVGDGMSVSVTHVKSEEDARPFAESYCHKYGREAHFIHMIQYHTRRSVSDSASFDCVAPSG
jgi:hypothetical protein